MLVVLLATPSTLISLGERNYMTRRPATSALETLTFDGRLVPHFTVNSTGYNLQRVRGNVFGTMRWV